MILVVDPKRVFDVEVVPQVSALESKFKLLEHTQNY